MLVVGVVRQCGGDLLKVEAVQIKHRTTVVRAARYSRQVCAESAGLPAGALVWKPQVALLVNEPTLLPVLMPLAPAATWPARIAQQVAAVLTAHGTPTTVIDEELRRMRDCCLARTINRSVVGIMNEFTHLAEAYRDHHPGQDLLDLAMRLATTPCGPLYTKNISPDRELAAFLRSIVT